MTEISCIEQDALVDYLYGEADDDTRRRIETHARGCAQCADEIGGLREVRDTLETWKPPPAAIGFRVVSPDGDEPQHRALAPTPRFGWGRLRRVPGWGLAAARRVGVGHPGLSSRNRRCSSTRAGWLCGSAGPRR